MTAAVVAAPFNTAPGAATYRPSSAWIHREIGLAGFHWQEGYGAFTVSAGHIGKVREYVLHQEEHHRGTTFQEEYVRLLQKGLVEYDDRYLW